MDEKTVLNKDMLTPEEASEDIERDYQARYVRHFNPKRDISADAKYIVTHLWIIFVAIPSIILVLLNMRHC
jgi:hypothetical protein